MRIFANMRKNIIMGCRANKTDTQTQTNPHPKKRRWNLCLHPGLREIYGQTFFKYAQIALRV